MSKIEVNAVEPQCGTTLTLGASGDTVTLGSGASQSGFGRTGTVDWQTTTKTGNFTAANGEGYFVDTTSSAVTMTMPSGSAGAIVSIQDYNKTFDTNNFTITPASGEKINGGVASASLTITTEGQGLTFVYVDSTVGWKTVHENEFTLGGSNFISATGGTITTSGDCKIHTFTGPGTFCVSTGGSPTNGVVSYMVIAGGGGGSGHYGGGGGAGGYREFKSPVTPYTASPLDGNPGGTSISITGAAAFPITVGSGGAGGSKVNCGSGKGTSGSNSIFSTVTSTGGGGGGNGTAGPNAQADAFDGGSGGGAGTVPGGGSGCAGAGNTPPVSPSQGNNGGTGNRCASTHTHGGGGGGASAVGQNAGGCSQAGPSHGSGGAGVTSSINGTPTARAGGGGGSVNSVPTNPVGGAGGGGDGGAPGNTCASSVDGTANTGGGGGGINGNNPMPDGGTGGSGIVIIRYKFQ